MRQPLRCGPEDQCHATRSSSGKHRPGARGIGGGSDACREGHVVHAHAERVDHRTIRALDRPGVFAGQQGGEGCVDWAGPRRGLPRRADPAGRGSGRSTSWRLAVDARSVPSQG